MYAEHTAAEFRDHLNLDPAYMVDGLLIYGSWDLDAAEHQLPLLRAALDRLARPYTLRRFEVAAIGHAWELVMDGRHYWYAPVMGTAVTANYVHVASLLGSRRNILLGIVGGLGTGMHTADMILPNAAEGNDSAAFYSADRGTRVHVPNAQLRAGLRAALPTDLPLWEGPTTTCEMMLAETRADVDAWHRQGFLGVEMEAALVFAASQHFGVPAAALFYVADNLIEAETMLTASYTHTNQARLRAREVQYQAGLAALLAPLADVID